MRRAAVASMLVHAGAIGAAWLVLNAEAPVDELSAESVSIEIVTMEAAISTEPSEIVTEATETLVSAGSEAAAPETIEPVEAQETEAVEPMTADPPLETVQPVAHPPAPAVAPVEPVEAEDVASAEVLSAVSAQPVTAEAAPPSPVAEATEVAEAIAATASDPLEQIARRTQLRQLEPEDMLPELPPVAVEPAEAMDPIETAALSEALEPLPEEPAEIVPIPKPRIVRKALESPKEPVRKPAEKPAEKPAATPVAKPADKPPARAASAGNGGAAAADSAARPASGGKGRTDNGGSAAVSKYPGLVQAKVTRAARYPSRARGVTGEAQVAFTIGADGRVLRVALARSSGNAELDAAAMAAVERAAPFPPIPADAGRSNWPFTVPLMFRR